jgi:hypothetical protein
MLSSINKFPTTISIFEIAFDVKKNPINAKLAGFDMDTKLSFWG